MERQPFANGGPVVGVFRSGQAYHTRRADQDPDQLCGMLETGTVANHLGAILDRPCTAGARISSPTNQASGHGGWA